MLLRIPGDNPARLSHDGRQLVFEKRIYDTSKFEAEKVTKGKKKATEKVKESALPKRKRLVKKHFEIPEKSKGSKRKTAEGETAQTPKSKNLRKTKPRTPTPSPEHNNDTVQDTEEGSSEFTESESRATSCEHASSSHHHSERDHTTQHNAQPHLPNTTPPQTPPPPLPNTTPPRSPPQQDLDQSIYDDLEAIGEIPIINESSSQTGGFGNFARERILVPSKPDKLVSDESEEEAEDAHNDFNIFNIEASKNDVVHAGNKVLCSLKRVFSSNKEDFKGLKGEFKLLERLLRHLITMCALEFMSLLRTPSAINGIS